MRPVSLGSVSLGRLDCGEFLAMPVDMPLPPGCSGVLGLDFLSRFDWELDFPALKARIAITITINSNIMIIITNTIILTTITNIIAYSYNLKAANDTVGNPHRAQIYKFELLELIL